MSPSTRNKNAILFCLQLLTKNPTKRLGCGANGERDVKDHAFFRRINWQKVEAREVQPPYIPKIVSTVTVLLLLLSAQTVLGLRPIHTARQGQR